MTTSLDLLYISIVSVNGHRDVLVSLLILLTNQCASSNRLSFNNLNADVVVYLFFFLLQNLFRICGS